jgi:hypothetical protein
MKNIHIFSTDKPSRLLNFANQLIFDKETEVKDKRNQNIYITSDEEIKEGDWHLNIVTNKISKYNIGLLNPNRSYYKKIILTTDQDLIKDGVQAIDDEFLECFVKNPSCESVEVETKITKDGVWTDLKGYVELPTIHSIKYKIIIPKEELSTKLHKGEVVDESYPKEFKQETLEEVAERFYGEEEIVNDYDISGYLQSAFLTGAKLQQEQDKNKYSEEDMKLAFEAGHKKGFSGYPNTENWKELSFEEWFEKFKKK